MFASSRSTAARRTTNAMMSSYSKSLKRLLLKTTRSSDRQGTEPWFGIRSFSTSNINNWHAPLMNPEDDSSSHSNRQPHRSSLFENNNHHILYIQAMPHIHVQMSSQQNNYPYTLSKRYNSSFPVDDDKEGKQQQQNKNASFRSRMEDRRDHYVERAEHYRDSAKQNYAEFKEHPAESTKAGARTAGEMIKLYGPVFIGTYMTIYVSTLATLFAGVESGVLDPVALFSLLGHAGEDTASTVHLVVEFMKNHSMTANYAHIVEENPSVANLAVAWIAVKFLEPARLALAIPATPKVAQYLGYTEKVKECGEVVLKKEKDASIANLLDDVDTENMFKTTTTTTTAKTTTTMSSTDDNKNEKKE